MSDSGGEDLYVLGEGEVMVLNEVREVIGGWEVGGGDWINVYKDRVYIFEFGGGGVEGFMIQREGGGI